MDNISLISQIDVNFCQSEHTDIKQNICNLGLLNNVKSENAVHYISEKAGVEESIGNRMTALRLSKNLLAKDIAGKIGFCTSTISRYENDQITSEHTDLELLKKYALCCGADKYFLFDGYLIFREFKNCILNEYITERNITKTRLSQELSVSKPLVLSWFSKQNRSPSHELWQTAFKEFTLVWIKKNLNSLKS